MLGMLLDLNASTITLTFSKYFSGIISLLSLAITSIVY